MYQFFFYCIFIIICFCLFYFYPDKTREVINIINNEEKGTEEIVDEYFLNKSSISLRDVYKKKKLKKINVNEERVRDIFKKIFNKPFKSVRPDWLKNPTTGKNLELDGYEENVNGQKIAFEYQGQQHYEHNEYFHGDDRRNLIYQKTKDLYKSRMCVKHGVILIEIPYTVKPSDMESFIRSELDRKNVNL